MPVKPDQSLALFDIDGTLTDGFTIAAFAEFLSGKGCFNPACFELMQDDKATYQRSARTEQDYHEFAVHWVNHYAEGLKDQQAAHVESLSPSFLESALNGRIPDYKIPEYARSLLEMINPVATTIAVSGSPWESLLSLTAYLGFKQLNSTLVRIERGRYTGQVERNLAITESKRQVVSACVIDGVDRKTSFAFGDSLQDVPMLEAVGNAFVMGSNPELQEIGRQRGWFVASPQDDVVGVVKERINVLFGG
jgi:phosphoserine phosphatase